MTVKFDDELPVDGMYDRLMLFVEENCNILLKHGNYDYYHQKDYAAVPDNYYYYETNKNTVTINDITDNIYKNESLLTNVLWAKYIVRNDYTFAKLVDKFSYYNGPFDIQFRAILELLFNDDFMLPLDISEKIILAILTSMGTSNTNTNNIKNSIFIDCLKVCMDKNMNESVVIEFRHIIENYDTYFNSTLSQADASYKACDFLNKYPELCSIELLEAIDITRHSATVTLTNILYSRSVSVDCLRHIKYKIINAHLVAEYIDLTNNKISSNGGIAKFLPLYTIEDFYKDLPDDYRLGVMI